MPALTHMEAHLIARDLGCLMSSRELARSTTIVSTDTAVASRRGAAVLAALRRWWVQRGIQRDLRAVPEILLRDIGIEPGGIDEVARTMACAERPRANFKA